MKTFSEVYEHTTPDGWLKEDEAQLLWDSARATKGDILEVGSYFGRSTYILGNLNRVVHSVDPLDNFDDGRTGDEIELSLKKNVEGLPVSLYRKRIEDWEPRPCGFAYLDGDHTYQGTIHQIEKALLCNPRLIAVHDVNDDGGGVEVKRACLERLGSWIVRVDRLAIFLV